MDVHLGELEVHLLQAFPAVSLRLLAYFALVGDDRVHRVDSRKCSTIFRRRLLRSSVQ